jgi:type II secretory pathway pseudopilin PulG
MRKQTGDTLVEVMLALAIMGAIIGGAYASASQSLRIARQAQERSEATKMSETQIERLKALAPRFNTPNPATPDDLNVFRTGTFCITTDQRPMPWPSGTPGPNVETDDFTLYPNECIQDRYHIAINFDETANDLFTIRIRWDRIGGGRDEVRVLYRLHKPEIAP